MNHLIVCAAASVCLALFARPNRGFLQPACSQGCQGLLAPSSSFSSNFPPRRSQAAPSPGAHVSVPVAEEVGSKKTRTKKSGRGHIFLARKSRECEVLPRVAATTKLLQQEILDKAQMTTFKITSETFFILHLLMLLLQNRLYVYVYVFFFLLIITL